MRNTGWVLSFSLNAFFFQYDHRCCLIISPVNLLNFVDVQELNVPEKDVEQLLVSLILDNRIDGHIDQVNRLLERGDRSVYLTCTFYF